MRRLYKCGNMIMDIILFYKWYTFLRTGGVLLYLFMCFLFKGDTQCQMFVVVMLPIIGLSFKIVL